MKKTKQIQIRLENNHRTSGIFQFYNELPNHIKPIQKSEPPYMKVDAGYFGYQGVVLHDTKLDLIQCHICGRWFKSLGAHLKIHDIDHITYKDRFGLYRSEPLARLTTRYKWSIMTKQNKGSDRLLSTFKKTSSLEKKRKKASFEARRKMAFKNSYGTCDAQLKFRLEQAIKKQLY